MDFSVSQENLDAVLKRIPGLESYAAKLDNVRQHLINSASVDSLTKTIDLFFEKAKSQSEDVLKVSVKIAQSVLENEAKKNVKIQMVSSIAEHLFNVDRIDDIVEDFGKSCSNRISKGFTKGQLVESIKSHIVEDVMGMQDSKLLTPKVVDNYNETFNNYFPNGQVNDSLAGKFAESYFVDRILPVNVKVIQDTQAFENYIDKKQNPDIKKTQKSIINDCASRALEILQEETGLYTFDKEKARKDMVLADYRSGVLFDYSFKRLDNDEHCELGKVIVDTLMPATNINFKREEKVMTGMEGIKESIGFDGLTVEECKLLKEELGFGVDVQGKPETKYQPSNNLYEFINGKYADQSNAARALRKTTLPRKNVMEEYAEYRKGRMSVACPKVEAENYRFCNGELLEDEVLNLKTAQELAVNGESLVDTFTEDFVSRHSTQLVKIAVDGNYSVDSMLKEINAIVKSTDMVR